MLDVFIELQSLRSNANLATDWGIPDVGAGGARSTITAGLLIIEQASFNDMKGCHGHSEVFPHKEVFQVRTCMYRYMI